MWNSPGFSKLSSNYTDLLFDAARMRPGASSSPRRSAASSRTRRPPSKLIPDDHRFGEKRPPFVTAYYEVFNNANVAARRPQENADHARDRAGIETADGLCEFDLSCGRPASTSAPARSRAWASAVGTVSRSSEHGPTVRRRSSASRPRSSRTSSSPAGRTRPPATTRATTAIRSTSSPTRSCTCATTATTRSRSSPSRGAVDRHGRYAAPRPPPSANSSYFFGTNIPGKPRQYLLNAGGRPKLFKEIVRVRAHRPRSVPPSSVRRRPDRSVVRHRLQGLRLSRSSDGVAP